MVTLNAEVVAAGTRAGKFVLHFDTVAELLAHNGSLDVGSFIEAGPFEYEVAPTDAATHHLTTAGGAKLFVQKDSSGAYNVQAFGAVGDGVTDDHDAFDKAFKAETLAAIRDEYATTPRVVIPPTDDGYFIDSDLVITRNIIIEGTAPHNRGVGGVQLIFGENVNAGFWFAHPGGLSALEPYVTEVGSNFYGAGRSVIRDLVLKPQGAQTADQVDVNYGIVNNVPITAERVYAECFKLAAFFSQGQTSGNSAYGFPYETAGSDGTLGGTSIGASSMFGNVSGSLFTYCIARLSGYKLNASTQGGYGFVAKGNNAGIVHWFNCDANRCSGPGFKLDTTIGSHVAFCHTAQCSWAVFAGDASAVTTTVASAVAANDTTVTVDDASAFTVYNAGSLALSAYVSIRLDSGAMYTGRITGISTNTLTVTPAIPSAATVGNNVYSTTAYLPIKPHVAGSANEPGFGADWRDYWIEIIALVPNAYWVSGTQYYESGGVNVSDTSAIHTIVGHYSEGGIEFGCIPRGGTAIFAGPAMNGRIYLVGSDVSNVQVFGLGVSNTPAKWTWENPATGETGGSALGTSNNDLNLFRSGHTHDPGVSAAGGGGLHINYSSVRSAYEFCKNATPYLAITTADWSDSPYSGENLVAPKGVIIDGTIPVKVTSHFSESVGPSGEVKKGELFLLSSSAAGGYAMAYVTTAGTVGSTAVIKRCAAIEA